ncbi:MAG: efflux RND transporter periplasmic adaptor subunit, partial [Granulosicoccus sp.]
MKKTLKGVLFATLVVIAGIAGLYRFFPELLPSQNSPSGSSTADAAVPAARGSGRKRPPPLIVAGEVTSALINDRLAVLGNGTALASVSVVPLSAGLLTDVLVTAGQRVSAGATLATLDNQEQLIERDRAASAVSEANTDVNRLQQLFRSNSTTEAELDRAKAELSDARLALRDAELKLSRRSVTAPIDGIVGFVSVDTGNYVTTQDELMTIDDRSTIVVEFWIPERFATQVKVGQSLVATALSAPAIEHAGTIVGIGSRIETDSRTLPVKASIENAPDTLRPGMSFELSLTFAGESFPAVDPLAIQWDSAGSFVWTLADGKVLRQNVRIIQRNPESVLVDAPLKSGDQVVTEGVLALR